MYKNNYELESEFNRRYSPTTSSILQILSNNSRATISEIAQALGISRNSAARRLKAIEKEFGISYTIELSQSRIGLQSPHIIQVKFDREADYEKIAEVLGNSYIPQITFRTYGLYDMVIYANATSKMRYAKWDREIRVALASKYGMHWRSSEVIIRRLGFFPFSNGLIDASRIQEKEKEILKILNSNSRMQMADIADNLGINYKTAIYRINELVKKKYIKRFTICMDPPKDSCLIGVFGRYLPPKDMAMASITTRRLFTNDDQSAIASRWQLKASLIGSYDTFAIGLFDNFYAAYSYGVKGFRSSLKSSGPISLSHARIGEVICGRLPIRNMDIKKEYREHMVAPKNSQ